MSETTGNLVRLHDRRRRHPLHRHTDWNGVERRGSQIILTGGGTRGFLHGGFVRALAESPIAIESFMGISIGAWGAAFYAMGLSVDRMCEAALDFDASEVFRVRTFLQDLRTRGRPRQGLFLAHRMQDMIERVIGDATFSDTVYPLTIQATDLATGRPFWFSRETTPDTRISVAVAASSALVGVFEPVDHEGHVLIDGTYAGYVLPRDRPVIISNISPVRTSDRVREKGFVTIFMRAGSFIPQRVVDLQKEQNHRILEIEHDCRGIGMLNFHLGHEAKRELMARSYAQCRAALATISSPSRCAAR